MDLGFADATAVIAGGTRGIGLATAVCLAKQGARIGVIGRDDTRLKETATALSDAGSPEVLTLPANLTSASDVDSAFSTVSAHWGVLNVLVNAAGPMGAGRFEDLGDAQWAAAFDEGCFPRFGVCVRRCRCCEPPSGPGW